MFSAAPVMNSLGIHLMLILVLRARLLDAKRLIWVRSLRSRDRPQVKQSAVERWLPSNSTVVYWLAVGCTLRCFESRELRESHELRELREIREIRESRDSSPDWQRQFMKIINYEKQGRRYRYYRVAGIYGLGHTMKNLFFEKVRNHSRPKYCFSLYK